MSSGLELGRQNDWVPLMIGVWCSVHSLWKFTWLHLDGLFGMFVLCASGEGYISKNRSIADIFVVCNALKYKHFERWATSKGIHMNRRSAAPPPHGFLLFVLQITPPDRSEAAMNSVRCISCVDGVTCTCAGGTLEPLINALWSHRV